MRVLLQSLLSGLCVGYAGMLWVRRDLWRAGDVLEQHMHRVFYDDGVKDEDAAKGIRREERKSKETFKERFANLAAKEWNSAVRAAHKATVQTIQQWK
jgi:hypothetical protein